MQEKQFSIGSGADRALLVFNLNVMAEIQTAFGSVSKWTSLLEDDEDEPKRGGEPDMNAFIKGFTCMLNEGVEIENETADVKKPLYTERQAGRLITKWGKDEISSAMKNAIASSTNTGDQSKNESSTTKTQTQA